MAGEKYLMMAENPVSSGSFSHNRRSGTTVGTNSHTEGNGGTASGTYSHVEGNNSTASGYVSHAEGSGTTAAGATSHAEGSNTTALGQNSHIEGSSTRKAPSTITDSSTNDAIITEWTSSRFSLAKGQMSHVEGTDNLALGTWSHAAGQQNQALGPRSHAEGNGSVASGDCSYAGGSRTAASNHASASFGKYNAAMTTGGTDANTTGTAFVVGNGTSATARANAFSVQFNGVVKAKSTITASTTADYAEFFEWLDGNPDAQDRVGHFVTLEGDKIRIANNTDEYILGVVSGEPFVLGNGDCDTWTNMHLKDEFRRTIYEPAPKVVPILGDDGLPTGEYEEVEGEFEGVRPKLNPEYDPTQKYISRFDRCEWAPVGMLGVVAVRHDGTAEVDGYVTVSPEGVATKCEPSTTHCYRVIKSNSDSVVEIIFSSGNGLFVPGDVFVDEEESGEIPEVSFTTDAANVTYDNTSSGIEAENVQDAIDTVGSIAKGKNRAKVFSTTESMNSWLSDDANKGLASVGDNLYIVDLNVPDWWIAEVLEEADAETGFYYKIAQLETQKVDLTTIEEAIQEVSNTATANQKDIADLSTRTGGIESTVAAINSRVVCFTQTYSTTTNYVTIQFTLVHHDKGCLLLKGVHNTGKAIFATLMFAGQVVTLENLNDNNNLSIHKSEYTLDSNNVAHFTIVLDGFVKYSIMDIESCSNITNLTCTTGNLLG